MRNYGQVKRAIKIKKRIAKSQFVVNLSEEAKQWAVLSKALRRIINK